jgi:hypothetical protein
MFVEGRNYRIKPGRREPFIQLGTLLLICSLMIILQPLPGLAQQQPNAAGKSPQPTTSERDRQHGFDFNYGTWKTHVSRLVHPLTGSKQWVEYDGTSVVSKVWNGRASLFELNVSGPAGHIEGMGLRLFNRDTYQWSLNWATAIQKPCNERRQTLRGQQKCQLPNYC